MTMNLNGIQLRFLHLSMGIILAISPLAVAQEAAPGDQAGGASSDPLAAANQANGSPGRVVKSDAEWRSRLTREQYMVTRLGATEPAFSGKYNAGHYKGTFLCVCCDAPLFDARTKFDSGTGWPSFWRPLTAKAMTESLDRSAYEPRIEVRCSRCGAHLGHVFADGPAPTGLRYCINSLALKLEPESAKESTKSPAPKKTTAKGRRGLISSGR